MSDLAFAFAHADSHSASNAMDLAASTSSTAASSSDPASSLRAAALLTLKSKRRKPTTDQPTSNSIPTRPPPPENSFMLDYGQDDIASSPAPTAAPTTTATEPPATDVEDHQIREEGEISDEEGIPSPATNISMSIDEPITSPLTILDTTRPSTPQRTIIPKVESPTLNLSERLAPLHIFPQAVPSDATPSQDILLPESIPNIIDADHVRPRLAMTQEQYDTAKDIVLDLLGWGVPPEYLVDCGLSREIVYYVFNELNLRLPRNLDINGLIPYTITPALEASLVSSMPPPPVPIQGGSRSAHGHLSLPFRPLLTSNSPASDTTSMSVPTEPLRLGTPTPLPSSGTHNTTPPPTEKSPMPATGTLHDMERQRRQELLARKAVQASRKPKQPATTLEISSSFNTPPVASSPNQDIEMVPVPTETVEDFLKTIETQEDHRAEARHPSSAMDVDEIPGLGGSQLSQHSSVTSLAASPSDTSSQAQIALFGEPISVSPTSDVNQMQSQATDPPLSTDSVTTTFVQESTEVSEQLSSSRSLQRRGTKRPVASDFVDFDVGPRGQSGNGYTNGGTSHPNLLTRRKTNGSFASVSGMRRCVIDLSDSEGEGEGHDNPTHDAGDHDRERWGRRSGYMSPGPGVSISMPVGGRWGTPPFAGNLSVSSAGASTSGTMSPAALMEKELEIRKMREMIALREQSRLKKLAAISRPVSTSDTTVSEDHGSIHNLTVSDAQEDDESRTSSASASASPHDSDPLQTNGRHTRPEDSFVPHDTTRDGVSNGIQAVEPSSGGEQALALEAQQQLDGDATKPADKEERQRHEERAEGLVDVDAASSSSTQLRTTPTRRRREGNRDRSASLQERHEDEYAPYESLFEWYPLLQRDARRAQQDAFLRCTIGSSSCSSTGSQWTPGPEHSLHTHSYPGEMDLRALRLATASKKLDPMKRICEYEVPGGGVCRDEGCEDAHVGESGGGEPSDEDTAEYVWKMLPDGWLREQGVTGAQVRAAVEGTEKSGTVEGRVVAAVGQLLGCVRPPARPT